MFDLRENGLKISTMGIALAAAAGMALVSGAANAADWRSTFLSTNTVEYIDNFVNDEVNVAVRDDDIRLSTRTQFYGTGRYQDGVVTQVGGRLFYFKHIDRTDQDNLLVGVFGNVGKRFGEGWFARVGYNGDYRRKDGRDQFIENTMNASLNYAPTRAYRVGVNGSVGYRDFDNQNFPGLDQTRLFGRGYAFWYPFLDQTFLYGEAGYQRVNADNSNQSTDLYFVGARFGYTFTEEWSVLFRTKFSNKDFGDGRSDEIFELFGRLDYDFSKNVRAFAEAGVVDQQSTVATQDFTGPRFGVGVRLLFNSGK